MKVFLYDYVNEDSSILLFGYTENQRKCEVRLLDFEISLDLVVDYEFFDTAQALSATIRDLSVQ
jgi:hypothetical protein